MGIGRVEDVQVLQKGRERVKAVYAITRRGRLIEDRALHDQFRRAAILVVANIAEGFDGSSDSEFVRFLRYFLRSASEIQALLYTALDAEYISPETQARLYIQAT